MTKNFEKKLRSFLEGNRPRLLHADQFEIKSCFGAKAGYWESKIFVTCGTFGIALKLPQGTIKNLLDAGEGSPLKYFKKGHVKKDYVVISTKLLGNRLRVKYLLSLSLKSVKSIP